VLRDRTHEDQTHEHQTHESLTYLFTDLPGAPERSAD